MFKSYSNTCLHFRIIALMHDWDFKPLNLILQDAISLIITMKKDCFKNVFEVYFK